MPSRNNHVLRNDRHTKATFRLKHALHFFTFRLRFSLSITCVEKTRTAVCYDNFHVLTCVCTLKNAPAVKK